MHAAAVDAFVIDTLTPSEALRRVRIWQDQLAFVEDHAVAQARAAGLSWAEIGRHLDRSRQLPRQRYSGREAELQELLAPPDEDETLIELWQRLHDPKPTAAEWVANELMFSEESDNFVVG